MTWVDGKLKEAACSVAVIEEIFKSEINNSWGPAGVAGKPEEIKAAVDAFGSALKSLIDIESDAYRTHGPEATNKVRETLLGMTGEIFTTVETLPNKLRAAIASVRTHSGSEPPILDLSFKFTFSREDQFSAAFKFMQASMKSNDW